MNKTLYKKDTKGKIRFAKFTIKGDTYTVTTGVDGSDKTVPHSKTCQPKNVGKANETTGAEQAIKELQAKYDKKLKEGYFETVDEATNNKVILPMLAKSYDKEKAKIDWSKPVYVQPKLDGQRMLCIKKNGIVTLISRKNSIIDTLDHIKRQMSDSSIPDGVYDGEAYCLELGTFQEQMKAIKKYGPNTKKINFHIYDFISDDPYIYRNEFIKKLFDE